MVDFTDGTVAVMLRRERSQLIWDDDSVGGSKDIVGLLRGVVASGDAGAFRDKFLMLVTPFRGPLPLRVRESELRTTAE